MLHCDSGKNGQVQKSAERQGIRGVAKKNKKIKKSQKKGWTKRYLFVPLNGAEIKYYRVNIPDNSHPAEVRDPGIAIAMTCVADTPLSQTINVCHRNAVTNPRRGRPPPPAGTPPQEENFYRAAVNWAPPGLRCDRNLEQVQNNTPRINLGVVLSVRLLGHIALCRGTRRLLFQKIIIICLLRLFAAKAGVMTTEQHPKMHIAAKF